MRLLPLPLILLGGCNSERLLAVCPSIGWYAVTAEVRDQYGRAAGRGATVRVHRDDGFAEEAIGYVDSLNVYVGDGVTGVFDITVTKPFHIGETATHVEVSGDPQCGIPETPAIVELTVQLRDNAPPVRQVVVPPYAYGFGDGNVSARVVAHVEADEGVSTAVLWSSRDTTVAHITSEGVVTSTCRDRPGSTFMVASAVANESVRDSVAVEVWAASATSGRCP